MKAASFLLDDGNEFDIRRHLIKMNIQEAKKRIDDLINAEIARGEIAGANFLVMHSGEPLFQGSYGYADSKKTKKMQENTIFRLFSLTKPVTATAVLQLFEQGKIDLWDPVCDYLEGFRNQKVLKENTSIWGWEEEPVRRDVTLWDLLTMTSGIPYPGPECEAGIRMKRLFDDVQMRRKNGKKVTTAELANEIGKIPLQFQPGEHWMYGASADILGAVIEMVTDRALHDYLKEEIFEPLQMTDTGFFVPEEKKERFAEFSVLEQGSLVPYMGKNDFGMEGWDEAPAFESAGAGLVSTMKDYANFTRMLADFGTWRSQKILGRKTMELMRQNHLNREQRASFQWDSTIGYGYGCLVRVLMEPGLAATNASVGEFGWDGWSGTYASIDPAEDLTILYFVQRAGAGMMPVVRKLRAVVYGVI
jgi:CubicO group peptidase (beta-lactamase class C family)